MTKQKCKMCNNVVDLRKNDIIVKLDKKAMAMHTYRITEQKNGFYKLELITEEKQPLNVRKKKARDIVSRITEDLKEQVPVMVAKALSLHDVEEMEVIEQDIDKGKAPKLKSKPGCVYLQTSTGKVFL